MKKNFSLRAVSAVFLIALASGLTGLSATAQTDSRTQAGSSDLSALIARQQLRMDTFENGLKDIRGTVEVELRDIRLQLEQLAASALAGQSETSVDVKQFQSEMARLSDSIEILTQRISRTLELTSDVEFRVLRLEKRMQTLMSLSGDSLSDQLAQQDVTAVQQSPSVSIGRDPDTGETVWTIEEDKLNDQLDANEQVDQDKVVENSQAVQAGNLKQTAVVADEAVAEKATSSETTGAVPAAAKYLPDASPEEQYRFALARALQNDLRTAENAFIEFAMLHPEHERAVDALFWQGRVQFIQGQFEKAATTFSKFNSLYSSDPRISDTTMWIAESVAKFANPEQACAIYDNLRQFVDQPPESFVARLGELSASAGCSS